MKNCLLLILLLGSTTSIAQSLPGKPPTPPTAKPVVAKAPAPAPPCICLTPRQRQRLADSIAVLPRVRLAAQEYRIAADTATLAAVRARTSFRSFSQALTAQQRLTNAMVVETHRWKAKARRRGLLNFLLLAGAGSLTYLYVKP